MTIYDILKDGNYKAEQFSEEAINDLNSRIVEKADKNDKTSIYVNCLVRKKEIKLTPEEIVRQLLIDKLINHYNYQTSRMELEYPVRFGREVKRADIVIKDKDDPTVLYIIIEVKKPKLKEGKEQLKSYCHATGAPIAVWTNGEQIAYYHRKDPNYFEDIRNIPKATQTLTDIISERWTIEDLKENDILQKDKISLKEKIEELENEVLANAGVDVFEECFKLIFAKLYDEFMGGQDKKRPLEFTNASRIDKDVKRAIQDLFDQANKKWKGVFSNNTKIMLSPSHLSICVASLQNIKFFNSNLEVVDDAFEYLINKSSKGEKGQFFTPRYVIEMCVRMMNPNKDEKMIDTACGSSGFPVHTIFNVWDKMATEDNVQKGEMFSFDQKPYKYTEYVKENVFGIDFDEKAVRVARTLNLIAGDGHTNILHLNTLDYKRWNETKESKDWERSYLDGFHRLEYLNDDSSNENEEYRNFIFDIVLANPPFAGDIKESRIINQYELGKNAKGKMQGKVARDVLFIERNLDFLKPGGRMAIVLPQGRFNNSSDKYIRDFIINECRILAVVGLHINTFKPHTGIKTSILFVQKWDDELCPKKDDYNIFFAMQQNPGKDNSGKKIYIKKEDDTNKLDRHGHLVVLQDLYNHDGITGDGIAEAFAEFAKKEKLSFFSHNEIVTNYSGNNKIFHIKKFSSLYKTTNRLDAEYYQPKYEYIMAQLDAKNTVFSLCDIIDFNFSPDKNTKYKYIELANVGNDGNIFGVQEYLGKDLPKRARRIVKTGQIIVSSIEGSLQSCALITDEFNGALCSTGFYVLSPKIYNAETLLVLFKSSAVQSLLKQRCSGSILQSIRIDELRTMPLPKIDNEIQKQIYESIQNSVDLRRKSKCLLDKAIEEVEMGIDTDEASAFEWLKTQHTK